VNRELRHLRTLFYQLVGVIEELVQVVGVLRLAGHSCKSLVPDDCLFVAVLDALSNEVLVIAATDLAEDEANFVFE
jgi:hypothetical protein